MWGNILTEVSHLHNINMSFLEHFLHLKGSGNVSYNLTYINTGKYNYNSYFYLFACTKTVLSCKKTVLSCTTFLPFSNYFNIY